MRLLTPIGVPVNPAGTGLNVHLIGRCQSQIRNVGRHEDIVVLHHQMPSLSSRARHLVRHRDDTSSPSSNIKRKGVGSPSVPVIIKNGRHRWFLNFIGFFDAKFIGGIVLAYRRRDKKQIVKFKSYVGSFQVLPVCIIFRSILEAKIQGEPKAVKVAQVKLTYVFQLQVIVLPTSVKRSSLPKWLKRI